MDYAQFAQWVIPVLSVGAAYGGVKAGLNGTKAQVKETKDRVKDLEASKNDHTDRLARIETKLDILLEKK